MKKLYIAIILLACVLAGAAIGYALTQWAGTINWTVEQGFKVWDSEIGDVELPSNYESDWEIVQIGQSYSEEFYLENIGDAPITVTATGSGEGCTAIWNNDGIYEISVGTTRVLAEITLTITGAGSYSWDFTISP